MLKYVLTSPPVLQGCVRVCACVFSLGKKKEGGENPLQPHVNAARLPQTPPFRQPRLCWTLLLPQSVCGRRVISILCVVRTQLGVTNRNP